MRVLVTGSAGHLGEALVCVLGADGHDVAGIDVLGAPFTTAVGSIADRGFVRRQSRRRRDRQCGGAAQAARGTHSRQAFEHGRSRIAIGVQSGVQFERN
jgi:UDP-glucose 4-epimerase